MENQTPRRKVLIETIHLVSVKTPLRQDEQISLYEISSKVLPDYQSMKQTHGGKINNIQMSYEHTDLLTLLKVRKEEILQVCVKRTQEISKKKTKTMGHILPEDLMETIEQ